MRAIRDYTSLKNRVDQTETELLKLKADIEKIKAKNNSDYEKIIDKVAQIEVDFVKANAKQTETLTKQIDSNFKIILDKLK